MDLGLELLGRRRALIGLSSSWDRIEDPDIMEGTSARCPAIGHAVNSKNLALTDAGRPILVEGWHRPSRHTADGCYGAAWLLGPSTIVGPIL